MLPTTDHSNLSLRGQVTFTTGWEYGTISLGPSTEGTLASWAEDGADDISSTGQFQGAPS